LNEFSIDAQSTNHALIYGAWYAYAAASSLVHGRRAIQHEDAQFMFKHPRNRARRKAGHRSNLSLGVRCLSSMITSHQSFPYLFADTPDPLVPLCRALLKIRAVCLTDWLCQPRWESWESWGQTGRFRPNHDLF
jgi:hypothetical protein